MSLWGWMQWPGNVTCRSIRRCRAPTGPSDRKHLLPNRLKANVKRSRLFTSTEMSFWHFPCWMFSWIKSSRHTRKVCLRWGVVYFWHPETLQESYIFDEYNIGRVARSHSSVWSRHVGIILCNVLWNSIFLNLYPSLPSRSSYFYHLSLSRTEPLCHALKRFPSWSNPRPRQISARSLAVTLKIHSSTQTSWIVRLLIPGGGDIKISWWRNSMHRRHALI